MHDNNCTFNSHIQLLMIHIYIIQYNINRNIYFFIVFLNKTYQKCLVTRTVLNFSGLSITYLLALFWLYFNISIAPSFFCISKKLRRKFDLRHYWYLVAVLYKIVFISFVSVFYTMIIVFFFKYFTACLGKWLWIWRLDDFTLKKIHSWVP